jgi:hypothetical protein
MPIPKFAVYSLYLPTHLLTFDGHSTYGTQDELGPASYAAHLRHNAAPLPLSVREAELASIKASERAVTSTSTRVLLDGASHIQLKWTEEARAAVEALKSDESGHGLNLAVLVRFLYCSSSKTGKKRPVHSLFCSCEEFQYGGDDRLDKTGEDHIGRVG